MRDVGKHCILFGIRISLSNPHNSRLISTETSDAFKHNKQQHAQVSKFLRLLADFSVLFCLAQLLAGFRGLSETCLHFWLGSLYKRQLQLQLQQMTHFPRTSFYCCKKFPLVSPRLCGKTKQSKRMSNQTRFHFWLPATYNIHS